MIYALLFIVAIFACVAHVVYIVSEGRMNLLDAAEFVWALYLVAVLFGVILIVGATAK